MSVRILTAAGLSFLCMAAATQASALTIKNTGCNNASVTVVCDAFSTGPNQLVESCSFKKTKIAVGNTWEPQLRCGNNMNIARCLVKVGTHQTKALPEATVYLKNMPLRSSSFCQPTTDPNLVA